MAKSKKEAGQDYLKQVLALIPEAQRTAVQEALSVDTAVEALGSPFVEAESAAEVRVAEATKKEQRNLSYNQQLDKWYTDTQGTFSAKEKEMGNKIKKANLITPADPDATPQLPPDLR